MKLLFIFLLLSSFCFCQSKKVQIEILTNRFDSLNTVLITTRDNATTQIKELNTTIDDLNIEISALNQSLSELELSISTLEKDNNKLAFANAKFKADLEEMTKKNLELEVTLNAIRKDDIYSGTDGNIQSLNSFSKNYENITAGDKSYLKFQKYPLPNSKQDIIQWLMQFEISSETKVVYNYDVDPEDWKGVTGMQLISYKNGIILQKFSGYEGLLIRMDFPFLSVNDVKVLFKQLNLLELAPGCLGEDDIEINFKYSNETMSTTVYFGNGC